jgi:undecaprenyl-diphosphatase
VAAGLFTLVLRFIPNQTILETAKASARPALGASAAISAVAYGMLTLLIAQNLAARWRPAVISAGSMLLILAAFARLYLGVSLLWEELIGLAFGLAWVGLIGTIRVARRTRPLRVRPFLVIVSLVLLAGVVGQETGYAFIQLPRSVLSPAPRQIALSEWLDGGWDTLPARRIGMLGEYAHPFSLQWAGSLPALAHVLETHGWRDPPPWTLQSSLQWLTPRMDPAALPVLPHRANGQQEALVLIYVDPSGDGAHRQVVRLWRSDVVVQGDGRALPLWTGTVSDERLSRVFAILTVAKTSPITVDALRAFAAALPAVRLVREAGTAKPILITHEPQPTSEGDKASAMSEHRPM